MKCRERIQIRIDSEGDLKNQVLRFTYGVPKNPTISHQKDRTAKSCLYRTTIGARLSYFRAAIKARLVLLEQTFIKNFEYFKIDFRTCPKTRGLRIKTRNNVKIVEVPGRILMKNFRTGFEILKKSGFVFFPLTAIKKLDPQSKLFSLSTLWIQQNTRSLNRRFALKPTALSLHTNQPMRDLS
ncbi:hypothetical protein QMN07_16665 [Leptospira santarosai]|uniref:hypothetical protein n=1 Tax=Leptospira santarosai TaxID=28183 RepID=UPI0024AF2485|nr:hypothetical protein [Leptospira santarosai]MDI7219131.1 hypothetical protein [Leptospira santarosai]